MTRRVLLPALLLPLLLTACPGQEAPPTETVGCRTLSAAQAGLSLERWPQIQGVAHWPASHWPTSHWAAPHVAGQVLVVNGSVGVGLSAQALDALAGVQLQAVLPGLHLAQTPAGQTDQVFAQRLEAAGLHTQPNYVYRALALPNDPGVPGNAGLGIGALSTFQTSLTRSGVLEAWKVLATAGRTPTGARVAVLDSAPDRSHPELRGRLEPSVSCVSPRPNMPGPGEVRAPGEHGTGVVGIIGARTNNALGLAGVVWSGPVQSIEVLNAGGVGSTADVAAGLNAAVRQGAAVINLSLGGPSDQGDAVLDAALDAALAQAARSAVLVAAAGNTAGQGVYYPASHPDVIAVGALGRLDDTLACYSARPSAERPRQLDIVAPGGVGTMCEPNRPELNLPVLAAGGGYRLEAGTSFSAPLVSGVAALMRAANPRLSAAQTRALLLESVHRSGGLPVLDAAAAVRAALR